MKILSINSNNQLFKSNPTEISQKDISRPAFAKTESDKFVSDKNKKTEKKNEVLKWALGLAVTLGLLAAFLAEKKVANTAKAERDAAEKAKKDVEKLKEELEKTLQEEEKKWKEFFEKNKVAEVPTDKTSSVAKRQELDMEKQVKETLSEFEGDKLKKEFKYLESKNRQTTYTNQIAHYTEQMTTLKNAIQNSETKVVTLYSQDHRISNSLIEDIAEELGFRIRSTYLDEPIESIADIKEKTAFVIRDIEMVGNDSIALKNLVNTVKTQNKESVVIVKMDNPIEISGVSHEKVFLPPITKDDIPRIIKSHIAPFAEKNVDFNKLIQKLLANSGEDFFSYDKLSSIIRRKIFTMTSKTKDEIPRLLTEQELLEECSKCTPDITIKIVNSFKNIVENTHA